MALKFQKVRLLVRAALLFISASSVVIILLAVLQSTRAGGAADVTLILESGDIYGDLTLAVESEGGAVKTEVPVDETSIGDAIGNAPRLVRLKVSHAVAQGDLEAVYQFVRRRVNDDATIQLIPLEVE